MVHDSKQFAGKSVLVSYLQDGSILDRIELYNEEYYEGDNPLIDSSEFRLQLGVRRLTGTIYNSKGELQQSFELLYDETGNRTKLTIKFADGTVVDE